MNRVELQRLAEDRILDVAALLAAGRWSAAYYLAGYAVECGLKSCVLVHILNSGVIFQERRFAERCWTHDLEELVKLAGLDMALRNDFLVDPELGINWAYTKEWTETSRYRQKNEIEARLLWDAVSHPTHGVIAWIRGRW